MKDFSLISWLSFYAPPLLDEYFFEGVMSCYVLSLTCG